MLYPPTHGGGADLTLASPMCDHSSVHSMKTPLVITACSCGWWWWCWSLSCCMTHDNLTGYLTLTLRSNGLPFCWVKSINNNNKIALLLSLVDCMDSSGCTSEKNSPLIGLVIVGILVLKMFRLVSVVTVLCYFKLSIKLQNCIGLQRISVDDGYSIFLIFLCPV